MLAPSIPGYPSVGVFFDRHLEFGSGANPIFIMKNDVLRVPSDFILRNEAKLAKRGS